MLEQGGNAVDAAVAMAGMLALAEPMMSGLGGDTMVLVWSARDQKVLGLNGSGRAGANRNDPHHTSRQTLRQAATSEQTRLVV